MVVYTLEQRWERLTEDAEFGKKFSFSDEAHFELGGHINKQNCRIWGTENPHAYIEKSTYPKRVTGVTRGGYWQYLVSTGRRYVLHSRSYTRSFAPYY